VLVRGVGLLSVVVHAVPTPSVSTRASIREDGPMLSIDTRSGIGAAQLADLDLGVIPSPAGSGELLLHAEAPDALLVLLLSHRDGTRAGPGIVTFVGCRQSVFGYPNDEARWGDVRLRGHGYGFVEVHDSPWPRRLDAYNRMAFPGGPPSSAVRHFVVACHETLGEFLAEDIRVEVLPDSFEAAAAVALRRLLG
jgi:hypothetical protein